MPLQLLLEREGKGLAERRHRNVRPEGGKETVEGQAEGGEGSGCMGVCVQEIKARDVGKRETRKPSFRLTYRLLASLLAFSSQSSFISHSLHRPLSLFVPM